MTTDCSLSYKFNRWKFQAQTWGEHVVYRNCFWHSEQFLYTTCSPHVLQKEELLTMIYLCPKIKTLKVGKYLSSTYFFNRPDPLYVAFVGKQSSIILWQVFVQHTRIVLRSHFVQIYLEKMKIRVSQKYSWKFQICFCFISFPPFNVQIWESIAFCWNWEQNLF